MRELSVFLFPLLILSKTDWYNQQCCPCFCIFSSQLPHHHSPCFFLSFWPPSGSFAGLSSFNRYMLDFLQAQDLLSAKTILFMISCPWFQRQSVHLGTFTSRVISKTLPLPSRPIYLIAFLASLFRCLKGI